MAQGPRITFELILCQTQKGSREDPRSTQSSSPLSSCTSMRTRSSAALLRQPLTAMFPSTTPSQISARSSWFAARQVRALPIRALPSPALPQARAPEPCGTDGGLVPAMTLPSMSISTTRPCALMCTRSSKFVPLARVLRRARVHTGCRRDVVGARREVGLNLWIDPPNARAPPCHLACACCRLVPPTCTGLHGAPAGS